MNPAHLDPALIVI